MVGAVITAPDGRIIGEGWHLVASGGPYAEVNAVASGEADADRRLFPESTLPSLSSRAATTAKRRHAPRCSSNVDSGRVVVAAGDPNP